MLADADPSNATAQRGLSVSYERIGDVQRAQGDDKAAAASYQEGLKIRQKLADADPSSATAQRDLFVSFFKLGNVAQQTTEFTQAVDWYQKALDVPKRFPRPDFFANEVRILEARLRFCREATLVLEDPEAVQKVAETNRAAVLNAVIQAHIRKQAPDKAVLVADLLVENAKKPGDTYSAACGYALCVPLADKAEVKERYAARAVALLKQAIEKGYKDVAHLKKDTDLDALRDREHFKALLKELEAMKPEQPK